MTLVRLNVQKVGIQFPREFLEAMWKTKTGRVSFADYLRHAVRAYRTRTGRQQIKEYPIVPGHGFPSNVRSRYESLIEARRGKYRTVDFKWADLPARVFYEIDPVSKSLTLNERYRSHFKTGARYTSVDAPLVKMLLMKLLEQDFDRHRITQERERQHEILNGVILQCIKEENFR